MTKETLLKGALGVVALAVCGVAAYIFAGGGPTLKEALSISTEPESTDTIPPTITAYPIEVAMGQTPDFRKDVTATSPYGKTTLTVDTSQVQLSQPGLYQVAYTAADTLGNQATKQVDVLVYNPHHKVIYLTFDDGPSQNTPKILQILRDNGAKATFFVTAQFPEYLPYLKQEHEEGHVVAAHTYSHNFNIYKQVDSYFADLDKIEAVIEQYTGQRTPIVRFPGGSSNAVAQKRAGRDIMPEIIEELHKRGYQYVDWNLDSQDASGNNVPAARLIASACHEYEPRLCLLMHDTAAKSTTVDALPAIIQFFKERGYEFGVINTPAYTCHHHLSRLDKKNKKS